MAEAGLHRTIPALPVREMGAAVASTERLGFEVLHHDGGFAVLGRDDACCTCGRRRRGARPSCGPAGCGRGVVHRGAGARDRAADVDALFAELEARRISCGPDCPASTGGATDLGTHRPRRSRPRRATALLRRMTDVRVRRGTTERIALHRRRATRRRADGGALRDRPRGHASSPQRSVIAGNSWSRLRARWLHCRAPCAPACSPSRSRRCCCRRPRRRPATRSCPCRRSAPACSARATRSCGARRSRRSTSRSSTSSTATPAARARGCSSGSPARRSTGRASGRASPARRSTAATTRAPTATPARSPSRSASTAATSCSRRRSRRSSARRPTPRPHAARPRRRAARARERAATARSWPAPSRWPRRSRSPASAPRWAARSSAPAAAPAARCSPRPPARSAPSRRSRCARAPRSASPTRWATSRSARSAPSPTPTRTACGRSATRSRTPASAACCCRTPTSTA